MFQRELLRTLPPVLRARDFHLYLEGGRRLTDLWLGGGSAILGHKPTKVLTAMKNSAERGLFLALPHPAERRFIKALELFFPAKTFRLYREEASLCRALLETGFSDRDIPFSRERLFRDPAFSPPESGAPGKRISLWRPFLDGETEQFPVLVPVLPWPPGPRILVLEKSADAFFPPGDLIAPAILAPAARALHTLAAALKTNAPETGGPGSGRYPKIEKLFRGGASEEIIWALRGIYLTVKLDISKEEYTRLFGDFLEGGFLIPPSPEEPLILPPLMSKGEVSGLVELLRRR